MLKIWQNYYGDLMVKVVVDITTFTNADGGENSIEYVISPDKSSCLVVTTCGAGFVNYTLPQITAAHRLNDPVFVSFASNFGITPQLLQSIIVAEYLRIVSQL